MATRLTRLLSPETVAVIGGAEAEEVIRQCRKLGYTGSIWAVNPRRDLRADVPTFRDLAQLPGVPDASFIAVPPRAAIDCVAQLAALGAPGAVVYPAGFAETGEEHGRENQRELIAAAGDMAIVGPNCHGYVNALDGVALWPDQHGTRRCESGVALILQSGNVAINLTMQQRGLAISHVISIGNKAVTNLHEYVDALLDDSRVAAIGLYLEGIDDVQALSSVALRALRQGVPIAAIKTGRSPLGAQMTLSHTSSMSAADTLCTQFFERYGIARCDTLAQLLETLKFLSVAGSLPDCRIASLSCSGGEASMVADIAARLHIDMPPLSAASSERLTGILGTNVHIANPLDYHTYIWGDYERLRATFAAVLDNGFDCTVLVLDYPLPGICSSENWEVTERALIDAARETGQRAAIVATLPETLPEAARARLHSAGVPAMQGLEECLFAIRAAAVSGRARAHAETLEAMAQTPPLSAPPQTLSEWDSKRALSTFGLRVPAGQLCSASELDSALRTVKFPVVLKANASDLAHKTEAGAVYLNLRNEGDVLTAASRLSTHYDQLLIEEMVTGAVAELIVGITRDPTFGLTLLVGAGGIFAELIGDTAELLFPVRREDIVRALESLKVSTLLRGYRGGPRASIDAIVDAIEAIVAYATANVDRLAELDVNPLIVTTDTAVAADALIRSA